MLDNLPVGTMAASGEGPVIEVDVTGQVGGFRNPVRPGDVAGVGLLDWGRIESVAEAGRAAARAALEANRHWFKGDHPPATAPMEISPEPGRIEARA